VNISTKTQFVKEDSRERFEILRLLAQPVIIRGKPAPAVPFVKHHQPTMNAVEQLQFLTLCIFYSTQTHKHFFFHHKEETLSKIGAIIDFKSVKSHKYLKYHPKPSCTQMYLEKRRWWWVPLSWRMFVLHTLQCHPEFCKRLDTHSSKYQVFNFNMSMWCSFYIKSKINSQHKLKIVINQIWWTIERSGKSSVETVHKGLGIFKKYSQFCTYYKRKMSRDCFHREEEKNNNF